MPPPSRGCVLESVACRQLTRRQLVCRHPLFRSFAGTRIRAFRSSGSVYSPTTRAGLRQPRPQLLVVSLARGHLGKIGWLLKLFLSELSSARGSIICAAIAQYGCMPPAGDTHTRHSISASCHHNPLASQALGKEYPLIIPSYFGLILRAFSALEGLGLQLDPQYSIVNECFPYLARR